MVPDSLEGPKISICKVLVKMCTTYSARAVPNAIVDSIKCYCCHVHTISLVQKFVFRIKCVTPVFLGQDQDLKRYLLVLRIVEGRYFPVRVSRLTCQKF